MRLEKYSCVESQRSRGLRSCANAFSGAESEANRVVKLHLSRSAAWGAFSFALHRNVPQPDMSMRRFLIRWN